MKKVILLSVVLCFILFNQLYAHGIKVKTELLPPFVLVNASFSASSMLIDARVEIFSPETNTLFQKGRTDTKGNFVFYPETIGEWKVAIDDERGHKRTVTVTIDELFFNNETEISEHIYEIDDDTLCAHAEDYLHRHHHHSHDGHMPMIYKIIFGLALIFGITGIFYGIKSKK